MLSAGGSRRYIEWATPSGTADPMNKSAVISMLLSWLQFVSFTVIPVAFRELLHWLYDWQILLSGILALVAARMWGRSVIKAARINARAKAASPVDVRRPHSEPVLVPKPLAAPAAAGTVVRKVPARPPELPDRLFALREQIRNTLGKMPCTDEILTAERLTECRKISEFPLGELPPGAAKPLAHRFDALRSKLSALHTVRESDTCRNAWEALVRISMDARDLMSVEPTKTAGK
jgi:hypothetical protein